MTEKPICFNCGSQIETYFEIVMKDGKPLGVWKFPKKAYMNAEYEVFCGYCDKEGDAE